MAATSTTTSLSHTSGARAWVFTYNFRSTETYDSVYERFTESIEADQGEAKPKIRYIIFQHECGAAGSTHHLQGYIELNVTMRMSAVKTLLSERTLHLEKRMGTREQARAYCTKDDTVVDVNHRFEYGEFGSGGQGKRNDITLFIEELKSCGSHLRAAEKYPGVLLKYPRGAAELSKVFGVHRDPMSVRVFLLFGETGLGKTRYVFDNHGTDLARKPPDGGWFDGFINQKNFLWDDFSGASSKAATLRGLLQYIDIHPILVPTKGGFVNFVAENIFVTTNDHPTTWYDFTSRDTSKAALFRRFHYVICFRVGEDGKSEPYLADRDLFFALDPVACVPDSEWQQPHPNMLLADLFQ